MDLNHGIYLEEELKGTSSTKFCAGVAGYPENILKRRICKPILLTLEKKFVVALNIL
jgi:hypothetical protein